MGHYGSWITVNSPLRSPPQKSPPPPYYFALINYSLY